MHTAENQLMSGGGKEAFRKENLQIQMELNVKTVRTASSRKSNGCQITPYTLSTEYQQETAARKLPSINPAALKFFPFLCNV
jgi:hypothetical protein